MTRINVVPVRELCDQHAMAEYRELTRIPHGVLSGRLRARYADAPREYVLGAGHVKFFVDKGAFLLGRYAELCAELKRRGYALHPVPMADLRPELARLGCWNGYVPTVAAQALNRARICERLPTRARWTVRDGSRRIHLWRLML